jgi:hypothetical protein
VAVAKGIAAITSNSSVGLGRREPVGVVALAVREVGNGAGKRVLEMVAALFLVYILIWLAIDRLC